MERSIETDSRHDNRPSPADFELYLPWACNQLQLEYSVQVDKIYQNEYVSVALTDRSKKGKSKAKLAPSRVDVTEQEKEVKSASNRAMNQIFDRASSKIIHIQAVYDFCENLVQIRFQRNNHLPRVMMKVIGLIMQFQTHLNTITINGGLDPYTIYEISKFLPTNHITDLCLDDCYLKEPNYYLLLENANFLRYLSLCRCQIDDVTVESLCAKLMYPLPASNTLNVLNLSSNRITDTGAKFLANILRCNRHLKYLNLASNMITDRGAEAIFNTLVDFPLTAEEIITSKTRLMLYLKKKNDMIESTIAELRIEDFDRRTAKRKSIRPPPVNVKKLKAESSNKCIIDGGKALAEVDTFLVEKAVAIVEKTIGNFEDPYSAYNTIIKNDMTYCKGNNFLCYLNVSYNHLSYLSLRKIESVLLYQKLEDRVPRGLLSVLVEGNSVPIACEELSQIDNILDINLMVNCRRMSTLKTKRKAKC